MARAKTPLTERPEPSKPLTAEQVAQEIRDRLEATGFMIAVAGWLTNPIRARIEDPTVQFVWQVVPRQ